ncbi:hypothetical protein EDB19DRAFT_1831880 [Suillus lakei]|nr:hypothetical protein EDB19DRAFT_1831880 [Suillus lakei]
MHTISPHKPPENQVLEDEEARRAGASTRPPSPCKTTEEQDRHSMEGTQPPLATYIAAACFYLFFFCPCLITAKKHATGGIAKRVSGPLGSPAALPVPASPGVEGEVEVVQLDVHSQWCLICCDGTEGDIVLYECSGCPWVMCSRCLEVLSDSHNITSHLDILFWCLHLTMWAQFGVLGVCWQTQMGPVWHVSYIQHGWAQLGKLSPSRWTWTDPVCKQHGIAIAVDTDGPSWASYFYLGGHG